MVWSAPPGRLPGCGSFALFLLLRDLLPSKMKCSLLGQRRQLILPHLWLQEVAHLLIDTAKSHRRDEALTSLIGWVCCLTPQYHQIDNIGGTLQSVEYGAG